MRNILLVLTVMVTAACGQNKGENPFLAEWNTPYGIPDFNAVQECHYLPAVEAGIAQQQAEIDAIIANPDAPTFENVVAAYEKFAPLGLEIYGVSFDGVGDEQKWIEFTEQNGMTWINVWGTGADGSWEAGSEYNVKSIPANFLYSPEGKLVAKDLRGEDIDRILSEYIK